jgi:cytochrome P450
MYYDVWRRGQYIWRIEEMHKQYGCSLSLPLSLGHPRVAYGSLFSGPIIRISPHTIHINDPNYIDMVYAGPSKRRDKWRLIVGMLSIPLSVAATIPHDLHRQRRAALNPYFSKQSIRRLEPIIQRVLEDLLRRMDQCGQKNSPANMSLMLRAVTHDIITEYSFGENESYITMEDFNAPFFDTILKSASNVHLLSHVGWLGPLLRELPERITMMLLPGMDSLFRLQEVSEELSCGSERC